MATIDLVPNSTGAPPRKALSWPSLRSRLRFPKEDIWFDQRFYLDLVRLARYEASYTKLFRLFGQLTDWAEDFGYR
jgi:hypothetical protein